MRGLRLPGGGMTRLPLAAIAVVLGTIVLTVVYYVAIRQQDVQLSFEQLTEFESHVQSAGNLSSYVVELPRRHGEELLVTALSASDWRKLSERRRIDFITFLYDDVDTMPPASTWLPHVAHRFSTDVVPTGYGVVLFHCGCIIPNVMFTRIQSRFDGYECVMLPGLVVPNNAVAFVNITELAGSQQPPQQQQQEQLPCARRNSVLSFKWYENFAWKLQKAREEHESLRSQLSARPT